MTTRSTAASHSGPFDVDALAASARKLAADQGRPSHAAFVFATNDYLDHLDEFCDILRVEGQIIELAGCTGSGIVAGAHENEAGSGFSLLAISSPDTQFRFHETTAEMSGSPDCAKHSLQEAADAEGWIALFNPFVFPVDNWLGDWNRAFPGVPCIGGLASGANPPDRAGVFRNGRAVEGGVVCGISGNLRMFPVVSQGCRPIGEPLTVTRAENNVIYALGAQPAYEALETAFQTLSDNEKSAARGNLFAGLATSEYIEEFLPGDFLIRSIIGADPGSGAVVIGGIPRVGQTLQYQYRDHLAASNDLAGALRATALPAPPLASLLFTCAGRGRRLFGKSDHDASLFQSILGPHPCAGLLCNGEISPVHSVNCLTAYSASAALFYHATQ